MSDVAIIIPARYQSSRFPGKPLANLRGATGVEKSLIERTWDAALAVGGDVRRVVATDDGRIAAAAEAFGAPAIMTSPQAANGTERCAEACDSLDPRPEIIVNLQGDAPLTPPWFIDALVSAMQDRPDIAVATPVLPCDAAALQGFLDDRAAGRVGGTTAVFDQKGQALYFSKEVVPYTGGAAGPGGDVPVYHHVGVYAYRRAALMAYPEWPAGPLERAEGLEQLRFMEHGHPVHCIKVDAHGAKFWELNNPADVPRIEAMLAEVGMP